MFLISIFVFLVVFIIAFKLLSIAVSIFSWGIIFIGAIAISIYFVGYVNVELKKKCENKNDKEEKDIVESNNDIN